MESKNSHEWEKKLIGKILLDDNTEHSFSNDEVVRMKDLPAYNRVLLPNSIMTRDYQIDRLNVHIDDNRKVERVYYG
ncbi:hypothetical protein INT46_001227 [Mucor plumbeus]|uniref:Uncharacterized protein n=1 Tax=Mucor plumbeus TaxID=97098 RepID=A0A8H7QQ87_9FUNG|nr:hypothetical protein INT46_001227 [Mucor plumbeus]